MAGPLVDISLVIQKKATKGGWHYVAIPGISPKHKNTAGLVRIKGLVDDYKISQFNLLPMSNGDMMLPLKATVRKLIGKKAGEKVRIKLYLDKSTVVIPEEISDSLTDAPKAREFFFSLSESNKKYYIDWINEARRIDTKAARIVKMIKMLERRKKFWDWPAVADL